MTSFLNCPWPWDREVPPLQEHVEGSSYGTAFHALQAAPRSKWAELASTLWPHAEELLAHAVKARSALIQWLLRDNFLGTPLGVRAVGTKITWIHPPKVEYSMVFNLEHARARLCAPPTKEEHVYIDQKEKEIAGTADIIIVDDVQKVLVVLDWKTGFAERLNLFDNDQIKTLLLMASTCDSLVGKFSPSEWTFIGGIILAHAGATEEHSVRVHAAQIPYDLLIEHLENLRSAQSRVGFGYLRPCVKDAPVNYCRWCPAREICPAQQGATILDARELLGAATQEITRQSSPKLSKDKRLREIGRVHQLRTLLHSLERPIIDETLDAVREQGDGVIERPDGRVLVLRTYQRESLSKSSIIRALGQQKGEQMLHSLREQGCFDESAVEQVVAVDNE